MKHYTKGSVKCLWDGRKLVIKRFLELKKNKNDPKEDEEGSTLLEKLCKLTYNAFGVLIGRSCVLEY